MTNLALTIAAARHQTGLSPRDQMIVDNLPLIGKVVSRYRMPMTDDVLSAGMVGLIRAVDQHDPARGKFSTFAFYCIRSAIGMSEKFMWRRRKHEVALEEAIHASPKVEPTYSDEEMLRHELLNRAFEAMRPCDQYAVRQHYLAGMTNGEIGGRALVSKQAINQRIQRGLRAARRAVA